MSSGRTERGRRPGPGPGVRGFGGAARLRPRFQSSIANLQSKISIVLLKTEHRILKTDPLNRQSAISNGLGGFSSPIWQRSRVGPGSILLCRYVERNGLVRSGLAQDWRWSSLWQRGQKLLHGPAADWPLLSQWPVDPPRNWLHPVNEPESPAQLEALRTSLRRGSPLGSSAWTLATAKRLGLTSTLRQRGRPRNNKTPTTQP